MDQLGSPLSVVLFSGTDDKLGAAAVLAVGAAVMGRSVNVFLQYYAVDAFRSDRIAADHGLDPEATPAQRSIVTAHPGQHWSELLRQAKDLGDVKTAPALRQLAPGERKNDLIEGVEEPAGAATALAAAEGAMTLFI